MIRRMTALLVAAGHATRIDQAGLISAVLGRDVATPSDVTDAEAALVAAVLDSALAEPVGYETTGAAA